MFSPFTNRPKCFILISMIDIELLRNEPEKVKKGIASKNVDPEIVDKFLKFDAEWRRLRTEIDVLRGEQRKLSEARNVEEAKKKKEQIKVKEIELSAIEKEREMAWLLIPNMPLSEVPVGKSEKENIVLREMGKKPKFDFPAKDYLRLAENLNLIDMGRAAKISSSRFGFLIGGAVHLEFALADLIMKMVADRSLIHKLIRKNQLHLPDTPFIPLVPPVLINRRSMAGMGYFERGEEEIYFLPKDGLYLVGTSEQSIGPMHQDEIFEEKDLPRRYLGFSTCFRREAGSYGKDTKGILRVHQFDKLEMFSFTTPEQSRAEHRLTLSIEEHLMQTLDLPYRVLSMCTGDLGDSAAAKFDVETWLPGQNGGQGEYRETHSTSNTTDFQSRRLNIRVKKQEAKGRKQGEKESGLEYVHMINGTGFAIGRMLIAIFENYQTRDGKIRAPKILKKYFGEKEI